MKRPPPPAPGSDCKVSLCPASAWRMCGASGRSSQSPPGHGGVNMSQHCHTADTVTLVTHSYTPATEPAHISRYVECREKPGVNNAISSIA